MPGSSDRRLDPRALEHSGELARDCGRKKKRLTIPERKPYVRSQIAQAPERKAPIGAPEASPFPSQETESDEDYIDIPSDFDLAEELGSAAPMREEDMVPDDGSELPQLDVVEKRIPEKTRVLMEELFRAKLSKVERVNPKKIQ